MSEKILAVMFITIALCSPKYAYSWSLGEEREVEPSIYVTLYKRVGSFDIWKKETRDAKSCIAISHASGFVDPYKGSMIFDQGPQVQLRYFEGSKYSYEGVRADVQVAHSCNNSVQWRRSGDRFGYTSEDDLFKPDSYDNIGQRAVKIFDHLSVLNPKQIEVSGHTYRYCEIYLDRSDHSGLVDLSGLIEAGNELKNCGR